MSQTTELFFANLMTLTITLSGGKLLAMTASGDTLWWWSIPAAVSTGVGAWFLGVGLRDLFFLHFERRKGYR